MTACRFALLFSRVTLVAGLMLGLGLPPAQAQTTSGAELVARRFPRMNKGFNVGTWFHKKNSLAEVNVNAISDTELRQLRGLTANYIRLPVSLKLFTSITSPGTPDPAALAKLDTIITRVLAQGLAIKVTVFDEKSLTWSAATKTERDAHCAKFATFWEAFARHLSKHNPEMVFLEMLNEPYAATTRIWYEQQPKLLAAARRGAPNHTLVADANLNITPGSYDTMKAIEEWTPVADPNVVYNFHMYKTHAFSHQAVGWDAKVSDTAVLDKVPYPAKPEQLEQHMLKYEQRVRNYIRYVHSYGHPSFNTSGPYTMMTWNFFHMQALIKRVKDWADRHSTTGRKVYVSANEFGVYKGYEDATGVQRGAEHAARMRWLHDVRVNLEEHNIAWAMWEYDGSFGLGERTGGRFLADPDTLRALGLPQQGTATVRFTGPANNATVTNLNLIRGTATHPTLGNAGIRRVDLMIYRPDNKKYWLFYDDEFYWSRTIDARPAVYSQGVWTRQGDGSNMPSGTNLPNGRYILTAIAYDTAGTCTTSSITVNVLKSGTGG